MEKIESGTLTILGEMSPKVSKRHVVQSIRQAIMLCWEMLPSERKSLDQLASEMGRIVDTGDCGLQGDESVNRYER
jgi:hypothetical protein